MGRHSWENPGVQAQLSGLGQSPSTEQGEGMRWGIGPGLMLDLLLVGATSTSRSQISSTH